MNIHEYQAKELFEKFGVPSPQGQVAGTAEEAEAAAKAIGGKDLVIKAQVHAGGRGKGTFKNGFRGGVHMITKKGQAGELASQMLGQVGWSLSHWCELNACAKIYVVMHYLTGARYETSTKWLI